jgi:hypothetical protein
MCRAIHSFFAKAVFRPVLLLTLTLVLFATFSHADTIDKQRLSEVEAYLRTQALQHSSMLPGQMRTAINWFSGGWHPVPTTPFLDNENDDDYINDTARALTEAEMPTPASSPLQLASNFHHKGFTHDALMMGLTISRKMLDDKLLLSAHPYYGQNWRSLQGYWGANLVLDVAQRPDDLPWGQITLGYVDGNEALIDHGRGIDFHGDVDLTNGFKFTSGMRQNSVDGNSNYVMLRWKLELM